MIDYFTAIVDPSKDWGPVTASQLQRESKGRFTKCYESSDAFLKALETYPLQVPLVTIADTAARTPSPSDGLFVRCKKLVPRCALVLYSGGIAQAELLALAEIATFNFIKRRGADDWDRLKSTIDSHYRDFDSSIERKIISAYAGYVASSRDSEISPIDGDDDEFAPKNMLVEMARGSGPGRSYIEDLLPSSMLRLPPRLAAVE